MNTQITIAKREEKNINGKDIINIYDKNGVRFTHFINPDNEGWEDSLQEGETVRVFAIKKHNQKNPKYPYRNIYKPRTEETDEEPVLTFEEQTQQQAGHIEDTPIADESNKNERIRWMNSLNNACRLIQGQVIQFDKRNPMKSIVQLANVMYKLEPQK